MTRALGDPPRVAVIGLGAVGAQALWSLTRLGAAPVGYEQFSVGNDLGASGGETRIFRVLYVEGAQYVPLLLRSRELWLQLEQAWGRRLLYPSGCLTLGRPDSAIVQAVLECGRVHDLEHEVLGAEQIRQRYPQYRLDDDEVGIFDPAGGILRSQQSILAAVALAESSGAEVRQRTQVRAIRAVDGGVEIATDDDVAVFDHAIVSPGSWAAHLLPGLPVQAVRIEQAWLGVRPGYRFDPESFPPSMRDIPPQRGVSRSARAGDPRQGSAQPSIDGDTVKYGFGAQLEPVDPDDFDRQVSAARLAQVEGSVGEFLDGAYPSVLHSGAYVEGYSPDSHALIGPALGLPGVTVVAGLSGHGFKLAPFFGETAAQLALGHPVGADIASFSPARFRAAAVS